MASLATGVTTRASCQKFSGSSRSSGGDVRAISASLMRRSRARSARPFVGFVERAAGFEGFGIATAFSAVAETGIDDATNDRTRRTDSIGEYHNQRKSVGEAQGDDATFAVISPSVVVLDVRHREDERGEREVKPALGEITCALPGIPVEGHQEKHRCIYV